MLPSNRWLSRRLPQWKPGTQRLSLVSGKKPTLNGCTTSRTGVSVARSGGGIVSPPGSVPIVTRSVYPVRISVSASIAAAAPSSRKAMFWIPGFHRPCGLSQPWVGRKKLQLWRNSTPPAAWLPVLIFCFSGSRG